MQVDPGSVENELWKGGGQKRKRLVPRWRDGFSISPYYIFFLSRESRWKIASATMIDALADTRRRERENPYIYIFSMRYRVETQRRIYIKVITRIRHMKSLYARVRHGSTGIWTYTTGLHLTSFSIFHRPRSRGFSWGASSKNQVKLGICPRYTNPDICQAEKPVLPREIYQRSDEGNTWWKMKGSLRTRESIRGEDTKE